MSGLLTALSGVVFLWIRARLPVEGFEAGRLWVSALAFCIQFVGYQKILSAVGSTHAPFRLKTGLAWSSMGWVLLATSLPGPAPVLGALNFSAMQLMLRLPLNGVLGGAHWRRPLLLALAFLAIVGCIPFATFSAYFQTFVPLMGMAEGVATMHQKLFSSLGLLAVITMLSVVYQSAALAYFYWSNLFGRPEEAGWDRRAFVLAAALAASVALGLQVTVWSGFLRQVATVIGFAPHA